MEDTQYNNRRSRSRKRRRKRKSCVFFKTFIIVFAILTATVVNYFSELQKAKYNDSVLEFMHKLEHLDTLSKED